MGKCEIWWEWWDVLGCTRTRIFWKTTRPLYRAPGPGTCKTCGVQTFPRPSPQPWPWSQRTLAARFFRPGTPPWTLLPSPTVRTPDPNKVLPYSIKSIIPWYWPPPDPTRDPRIKCGLDPIRYYIARKSMILLGDPFIFYIKSLWWTSRWTSKWTSLWTS
jgi:hypothetical protein